MSRQIGHFKFPDQPEGDVPNGVAQVDPAHPGAQDAGSNRQPAEMQRTDVRRFLVGTMGAVVVVADLLLLVFSAAPFYQHALHHQSVHEACHSLTGSDYNACVNQTLGSQARVANMHWNAWGSWFSWPAIVLFLIVAAVIGFKAVFSKSEKVVLSRQIRLALYLADLLFLVSVFHIPHDNAGRSWGLWLSLVCVIAINVGVLLATTHIGEWTAEHWPKRAKPTAATTEPTQPPRSPQQSDYRPTPQVAPPGQRQPSWPPPIGQQPFPQPGQQPFPPTEQRQFPPTGQR